MSFSRAVFVFVMILVSLGVYAAKVERFKQIEKYSQPKYLERKSDVWKGKSRVVGHITNAPEKFTMILYRYQSNIKSKNLKPYRIKEHNGNMSVYFSDWVPKGTYVLEIKAEGYDKFVIYKLVLKERTDCLINFVFGTKVYTNR